MPGDLQLHGQSAQGGSCRAAWDHPHSSYRRSARSNWRAVAALRSVLWVDLSGAATLEAAAAAGRGALLGNHWQRRRTLALREVPKTLM